VAIIGVHVTCWACGGDLATVNPGSTVGGTQAAMVVQCTTCRQEWAVLVHLRHNGNRAGTARLDGDNHTLAAHAARLVGQGATVVDACRQAGIPTTTYYQHRHTIAA
jgi:hypothetical protein